MIVVRLKGGLGNQMFQYALGRVLAIKNRAELKLDTSFLNLNFKSITKRTYNLDVFNIKVGITRSSYFISMLRRIFKKRDQEKSFAFDKNVLDHRGDIFLDGYWQSPKYFEGFEKVIREDFTLKNPPSEDIQNLKEEIEKTNSLCIHVRKGDYVGNKVHEVIDNEYYKRGIEHISAMADIEKVYIFSDDIEWCKNSLKFALPTMFVGDEYAGEIGEGHMYLMSKCKYFIIANSSFSWWGAWLSECKDKIIVCPKKWFTDSSISSDDLVPENWIRI